MQYRKNSSRDCIYCLVSFFCLPWVVMMVIRNLRLVCNFQLSRITYSCAPLALRAFNENDDATADSWILCILSLFTWSLRRSWWHAFAIGLLQNRRCAKYRITSQCDETDAFRHPFTKLFQAFVRILNRDFHSWLRKWFE